PTLTYPLPLHDALPIWRISPAAHAPPPGIRTSRMATRSRPPRPHGGHPELHRGPLPRPAVELPPAAGDLGPLPHLDQPEMPPSRSEEHTSELQSRENPV